MNCDVCLEPFQDARILPCGHSFCKSCIVKLLFHREITCPNCRTLHKNISQDNLVRNFALETIQSSTLSTDNVRGRKRQGTAFQDCFYLSKEPNCQKVATFYCGQCAIFLCEECEKRKHVIALVGEEEEEAEERKHKLLPIGSFSLDFLCKKHGNSQVCFYCLSCRDGVCKTCIKDHSDEQQHDLQSIDDACVILQQNFDYILEGLEFQIQKQTLEIDKEIDSLNKNKSDFRENVEFLKKFQKNSSPIQFVMRFDDICSKLNIDALSRKFVEPNYGIPQKFFSEVVKRFETAKLVCNYEELMKIADFFTLYHCDKFMEEFTALLASGAYIKRELCGELFPFVLRRTKKQNIQNGKLKICLQALVKIHHASSNNLYDQVNAEEFMDIITQILQDLIDSASSKHRNNRNNSSNHPVETLNKETFIQVCLLITSFAEDSCFSFDFGKETNGILLLVQSLTEYIHDSSILCVILNTIQALSRNESENDIFFGKNRLNQVLVELLKMYHHKQLMCS